MLLWLAREICQGHAVGEGGGIVLRLHMEAGRKQVGDDLGVSSIDEKSSGKSVNRRWKMEKVKLTGSSEIIE